ncbi:MAG: TRAP transporter permease, partial [Gemmatimonadetes bacterium]|nr:TRAP transporter permease [Gemmatimonadota bacterium]
SVPSIVVAVLLSGCGVLLVAGALEGFVRAPLRPWERVVMAVAGLALISPGTVTDVVGLLLAVTALGGQFAPRRRDV